MSRLVGSNLLDTKSWIVCMELQIQSYGLVMLCIFRLGQLVRPVRDSRLSVGLDPTLLCDLFVLSHILCCTYVVLLGMALLSFKYGQKVHSLSYYCQAHCNIDVCTEGALLLSWIETCVGTYQSEYEYDVRYYLAF